MNSNASFLSDIEKQALNTLCEETFAAGAPVDAIAFRADHEQLRGSIQRLCQLRYVDNDHSSQTYLPTVLGLKECGTSDCSKILSIGSKLLELFGAHYRNKATRKNQLLYKDIATVLGIERSELDLAMSLLANSLSLALAGRSIASDAEDSYVLPGETAFDYPNINSIVALYEGYRNQALNASETSYGNLPASLDGWHPIAGSPKHTPIDADLLDKLPESFRQVMREVEIAVSQQLRCLAVMGLRAVLDMFASELAGGDIGGFKEKIQLLRKDNLLNARQIEIVEAALAVGHAAAHRMHVPSPTECQQVLEIVTHLLREHYLLAPSAEKLKGSAPTRQRLVRVTVDDPESRSVESKDRKDTGPGTTY